MNGESGGKGHRSIGVQLSLGMFFLELSFLDGIPHVFGFVITFMRGNNFLHAPEKL